MSAVRAPRTRPRRLRFTPHARSSLVRPLRTRRPRSLPRFKLVARRPPTPPASPCRRRRIRSSRRPPRRRRRRPQPPKEEPPPQARTEPSRRRATVRQQHTQGRHASPWCVRESTAHRSHRSSWLAHFRRASSSSNWRRRTERSDATHTERPARGKHTKQSAHHVTAN